METLISKSKISLPDVGRAMQRPRLLEWLDEQSCFPCIWLGAEAASGKTTLAASYCQSRQKPTLWYQLDESDADLAQWNDIYDSMPDAGLEEFIA